MPGEIRSPLDLIHHLVRGENFDVVRPAISWNSAPAQVWSRAIASALQVYDSQAINSPASIQLRRAEQFVWQAKLQNIHNTICLHVGLVVDITAVAKVIGRLKGAQTTLRYDGSVVLLIELPKCYARKATIGDLIAGLKSAGVEAYLG